MSITHSARGPHVPGQCTTRGLHNANYSPTPPRAGSAAVSESVRSGQERSNIRWGSNFDLLAFRKYVTPEGVVGTVERVNARDPFRTRRPELNPRPLAVEA
jgi:hypothetical protein